MVECDENMTKFCYASFLTFLLYYETNPFDFLEVKWLKEEYSSMLNIVVEKRASKYCDWYES